ncbi:hypothetical protein EGW08_017990 [Elysia chlorotica]|uniref:Uncharacterized protein n=1 Tax=Elysia chlorotica TaxID=188477 RepID=A0A3S1AWT3_ELYCH|nr:hypothetical protein EGW08_017990 [Elysia chlorotica]
MNKLKSYWQSMCSNKFTRRTDSSGRALAFTSEGSRFDPRNYDIHYLFNFSPYWLGQFNVNVNRLRRIFPTTVVSRLYCILLRRVVSYCDVVLTAQDIYFDVIFIDLFIYLSVYM